MGGAMIFFFGDFRLSPWGYAHKFYKFSQKVSIFMTYKSDRNRELKFSNNMNEKDKTLINEEFNKIRNAIYYYLLESNNMDDDEEEEEEFEYRKIRKVINKNIVDIQNIKKMFDKYKSDDRDENLEFSNDMNEGDQKLLNDEFRKIKYVVDNYLLGTPRNPNMKMFAKYKYERELLKFSNNMNKVDQGSLNEEFNKIRHMIDNYLLGTPKIQEIFDKYKLDQERKLTFSKIDEENQELLKQEFRNIRHVIYNYLLDIPEDQDISIERELEFSNNMSQEDQKLLKDEFSKIKHVINNYMFGKQKDKGIFKKYKHKRKLKLSNNINESDQKLLNEEFRDIRHVIDNYLLDKPKIQKIFDTYQSDQDIKFSNINDEDQKLLNDEFREIRHEFRKIRHVIDNYMLDIV
jgi:hypothetical protein